MMIYCSFCYICKSDDIFDKTKDDWEESSTVFYRQSKYD